MHAPEAMKPPAQAALAAVGLEPPPVSPFDEGHPGPFTQTELPSPQPEPAGPRLNRAQRRRLRAMSLQDARLLGRVAQWDVGQQGVGSEPYANERAATYGLEHAAKQMRLLKLLSRSEQVRVQFLARFRRNELKVGK